jgi:hypothetical protein
MGYEQDFLKARKKYLSTIKDKDPSKELIAVVEEDKSKTLAKKLDQLKGKRFSEMLAGQDAFENNRIAYIKRIGVQIAKEDNADKLRPTMNKYGEALRVIADAFQDDCYKQQEAEKPPPPPPMPKAKAEKSGEGNPIAAAAAKIMLGKVSEGYRKVRQKQLDLTIEAEKHCLAQRSLIDGLLTTLQKAVKQAVVHSRAGQVREAAGLKIAGQGHVTKIKALSAGVKKKCHDSLEPFFKERILKAEVVAKSLHIDLPDTHVKELAKIPQAHARILNTASAHAAAAGRILEECEQMAEDAASLQSQIVDIAEGKDFGKLFLDGAVKMGARVKPILDKAIAEAEKLQNIMIPGLAKTVKILEDNAPPERVSAAQAYVNANTRLVKLSMGECAEARATPAS